MPLSIDYPKQNETIGPLYNINILAEGADHVRVRVDQGDWVPCHYADGRWWHSWENISPGPHTLRAEATHANQTIAFDAIECRGGEAIQPSSSLTDIWSLAKQKLKDTLGESNINLWLNEIHPIEIQGATLSLQVPNSFFGNWVLKHQPEMSAALHGAGVQIGTIECRIVEVKETTQPETPKEKQLVRKTPTRKSFQLPAQSFHEKTRFSMPISVASKQLASKLKMWEVDITRRQDGKTMRLLWKFFVAENDHLPGPECENIRLAIERILTERRRHRPDGKVHLLEKFTAYEIYHAMGKTKSIGKGDYTSITTNLLRLARTNYLIEPSIVSDETKEITTGVERWHFWEKVYVSGDKLPDGTAAKHITIELNQNYLAALNSESKTQRLMPYNDDLLLSLSKGVSRRLLRILDTRFYGMTGTYAAFPYPQLCALLGLIPEKELRRAKQQLKPYHNELMNLPNLYQKWQRENRGRDIKPIPPFLLRPPEWDDRSDPWRILYYPGPNTKIRQNHRPQKAIQQTLPL